MFDPRNTVISCISRRVVGLENELDRAELEGKRPGWRVLPYLSPAVKDLGVLLLGLAPS